MILRKSAARGGKHGGLVRGLGGSFSIRLGPEFKSFGQEILQEKYKMKNEHRAKLYNYFDPSSLSRFNLHSFLSL